MNDLLLPVCDWCQEPCEVPENTRHCDCPNHDGEEAVYCSRSCKVAAHG